MKNITFDFFNMLERYRIVLYIISFVMPMVGVIIKVIINIYGIKYRKEKNYLNHCFWISISSIGFWAVILFAVLHLLPEVFKQWL